MRRALAVLALGTAFVAGLAPVTAQAGSPPAPAAAPRMLPWESCGYEEFPTAECTMVAVPLDYDDPDGPTTSLRVVRLPASGDRIGSLFVNPGGPGGSSTEFALYAGDLIGPGVSERFDVIGVEPRGVGTPAWCQMPNSAPTFWRGFPVNDRQVKQAYRADRALNEACADERAELVDHVSTADVARDMDLVREMLGEEQLSYYGISYGSLLGQTYAAMFPDRVRAMIIDGVLDPVEWTAGRNDSLPMTFRLRSGKGSYEALTAALNECDRVGKDRCSIAGHANETWIRVYNAARRGDLRLEGGDYKVTQQEVVDHAKGALYSPDGIRYLIRFLRDAGRALDETTATTQARADDAWARLEEIREDQDEVGPYGVAWDGLAPEVAQAEFAEAGVAQAEDGFGRRGVQFEAVLCSDSVNPTDRTAWARTSRLADRTQPWFGRSWTWYSSLCAEWPGTGSDDAFRGPWEVTTSAPLLIANTTHDPATPISGARAANRLFEDSVLLTLEGWGHGALDTGDCIADKMAAYLIDGTLPPPSTICRPDRRLFPK